MSDAGATDATEDEAGAGVPSAMADLFFTLIAVVVLMLLALLPALRTPGALASARAAPWETPLTVEGRAVPVLVAQADGLHLPGPPARLVPVAQIATDEALRALLTESVVQAEIPLLFVAEGGDEATFLLDGLAASVNLRRIDQVRIDRACRFAAPDARRFCDPTGWAAPDPASAPTSAP